MTLRSKISAFASFVLLAMISVTTWSSLEKGVGEGFRYVFAERWGIATLFDAYFGFAAFFLWVIYKESSAVSRILWGIGLVIFGNIAIAIYLLKEARKLKASDGAEILLVRRSV